MFCKNLRSDDLRVQNFESHCIIVLLYETPHRAIRTRRRLSLSIVLNTLILKDPLSQKTATLRTTVLSILSIDSMLHTKENVTRRATFNEVDKVLCFFFSQPKSGYPVSEHQTGFPWGRCSKLRLNSPETRKIGCK